MPDAIQIRNLKTIGDREIQGLSEVLIDCVEGGASVSFMLPMSRAKAEAFWRGTSASVARGERVVLAAEDAAGAIVGTVQVILAQPENQPHRGDLAKMLVHRRARRRGIGAALLAAAERSALSAGKTLLVLDTASGDAERLYARQGWQPCGQIPSYALWPDGTPCATTIYFSSCTTEAIARGSIDLVVFGTDGARGSAVVLTAGSHSDARSPATSAPAAPCSGDYPVRAARPSAHPVARLRSASRCPGRR